MSGIGCIVVVLQLALLVGLRPPVARILARLGIFQQLGPGGRFRSRARALAYSASLKVTERAEARVLVWTTKRKPADSSTPWSSRELAAELGAKISHMSVARIWAKHGLKPHRLEGCMASNDPAFETKAADIIGLYLKSPRHAAVFCVDEKTAIQARDREDPSVTDLKRKLMGYIRHYNKSAKPVKWKCFDSARRIAPDSIVTVH